MKKLVVIALLAIGLTSNAQKTIYAEANGNGVCTNLKTGEVINSELTSKFIIDFKLGVVTLTIENGQVMYNITEKYDYKWYDVNGKLINDKIVMCSNELQKIKICYSDDVNDQGIIGYTEMPEQEFAYYVYKLKPSKTKNYATVKKIKKN